MTSVLDLPAPVAARLRRPGWRDPRLLAGIAMVAASVLLGSWVVRSAQRTVAVYVAHEALVAGQPVAAGAVTVVDVQLGAVDADRYLSADEPLPTGETVLRTVGAGELVPRSAIGSAPQVDERPVAVVLSRPLAASVVPGSLVDLWFTPAADADPSAATDARAGAGAGAGSGAGAGDPHAPYLLAESLTVAEVSKAGGSFAVSGSASVQVLVPKATLPSVLAALAADGTLDVVPVPGSAR